MKTLQQRLTDAKIYMSTAFKQSKPINIVKVDIWYQQSSFNEASFKVLYERMKKERYHYIGNSKSLFVLSIYAAYIWSIQHDAVTGRYFYRFYFFYHGYDRTIATQKSVEIANYWQKNVSKNATIGIPHGSWNNIHRLEDFEVIQKAIMEDLQRSKTLAELKNSKLQFFGTGRLKSNKLN